MPRLTEDGVIRQLGKSLKDPDAAVMVEENLWREVAPVRAEISAADGEADSIDCGEGADTVAFDQNLDTLQVPDACENQQPR